MAGLSLNVIKVAMATDVFSYFNIDKGIDNGNQIQI